MLKILIRKSCRIKCFAGMVRHLTTQEVSAALRPFYFIVHPDLFGQHPQERAVNEDSLKRLSEYVTSLQVSNKAKPTKLVFYIRQYCDSSESFKGRMKQVVVDLKESSLRATVLHVLQSCGLPQDYVNSIPVSSSEASGKPFRPIEWHPSFYEATGRPNPMRSVHKPAPQLTLRTWLQMNITLAHQKMDAMRHVQEDILRLCNTLHDALSLQEIRWDNVWGISHFRGCLKTFYRLYTQYPSNMSKSLEGRILLFGNTTGVTRLGEIVLSSEDVPTTWMRLLASVGAYDAMLERLPFMEAKLSELLNGINVIRKERLRSHVMAEDYELLLNKLLNSLRRCQDYVSETFKDDDLSGLEMVVDRENAPMTLTSEGFFLMPASVPGTMVVDFIQAHKEEAYKILQDIQRYLQEEVESRERCVRTLELFEISKDETVTPQQMAECCRRLTDEHWRLYVSLQQCRLHISHYYSVMEDGQICIPWDWVGDS